MATEGRRNSIVFRSSPLRPKALSRTILGELLSAEGSSALTPGSASLALELEMEGQAAKEIAVAQPSPVRKLLAAFLSSSPGKTLRGSPPKARPASPVLSRSPSTASLLLQNAIGRPASPVQSRQASPISRPGSSLSTNSARSGNVPAEEGPGFLLFEDEVAEDEPFQLELPIEEADVTVDALSSEAERDKENVAPPRVRKQSQPTLELPSLLAPSNDLPRRHSTTDLPGSVGDVAREPRKRAGDELSRSVSPKLKQRRLL